MPTPPSRNNYPSLAAYQAALKVYREQLAAPTLKASAPVTTQVTPTAPPVTPVTPAPSTQGKVFDSAGYNADLKKLTDTGMSSIDAMNKLEPTRLQYYKTPAAAISGGGLSSTQTGIVKNQETQIKDMAAAPTPAAQEEIYNKNLDARKEAMAVKLASNPNVSPEYVALFRAKWNPKTGQMEGVTDAEWAKVPDYKRDLNIEKKVAEGLNITQDKQAEGLMAAYTPTTLANLITTGQVDPSVFTAQQLSEIGLTPDRIKQIAASGVISPEVLAKLMQNIQSTGAAASIADQNLQATPPPTNAKMDILAEALNAKNNFKQQQLGTSKLFEMAGLSGYSVLAQSLAQRSAEMKQKRESAAYLVAHSGGQMVDLYKSMSENYAKAQAAFDKQMDRLIAIDGKAQEWERAIDLAERNQKFDLEKLQYAKELEQKYTKDEYTITNLSNGHSVQMNKNTGEIVKEWDEAGNPISGDGTTNDDASPSVSNAPPGYVAIGDEYVTQDYYNKFFGIGSYGGQCGTWTSTKSTASKVGDMWSEKKKNIQITYDDVVNGAYTPKAGDKLLIPLGTGTDGKTGYGHVALVTNYNPETGDIQVVEANKNLDGMVHAGKYNLNTLQKKYPENFGFVKGTLKGTIKSGLNAAEMPPNPGLALTKLGLGIMETTPFLNVVDMSKTPLPGLNTMAQHKELKEAYTPRELVIPESVKYQQATSEYDSRLTPYLIPGAKSDVDLAVNSIIRQQSTPANQFPGRNAENSKKAALATQKVNSIFDPIGGFNWDNLNRNLAKIKTFDTMNTRMVTSIQQSEAALALELDKLRQLSKDYPRNGNVGLQLVGNSWNYVSNDPKYAAFASQIKVVADRYASLMKNATGSSAATTDVFLQQAMSMLDPNMNDLGLTAQLDIINNEMINRYKGAMAIDIQSQLLPVNPNLPVGSSSLDTEAQLAEQRKQEFEAKYGTGATSTSLTREQKAAEYMKTQRDKDGKPYVVNSETVKMFLKINPNF